MIIIIQHITKILKSKLTWGIGCVLFTVIFLTNSKLLMGGKPSAKEAAEDALGELARMDPKAANYLAIIKDERVRQSLLIAAASANTENNRRSVLSDMANEIADSELSPYRAQLAELAIDDNMKYDDTVLEAFYTSHAIVCEALHLGGGSTTVNEYISLLKQAKQDSSIWAKVKNDPVALSIWSHCENIQNFHFYVKHQDLLAEPLALIDTESSPKYTSIEAILVKLAKYEITMEKALGADQLGVFGVAAILSHGNLIEKCHIHYDLNIGDVIEILHFNPTIFESEEGDLEWIEKKASWLATIEKQHPVVWECATFAKMALQLHIDAPSISDQLLEEYGGENIQEFIYSKFSEKDQVAAAAHAINKFGDLAIYVFTKYDDEKWLGEIGAALVNKDIGIRVVPFILKFEDNALTKMKDDHAWVDKHFDDVGDPRVSHMDWIKDIPGGAIVNVSSNLLNGYPCEWSELGWAVFDVADIGLMAVSFGASSAATTSIKTGSKVGVKISARKTLRVAWKDAVKLVKSGKPLRIGKGRFRKLRNIGNQALHYAQKGGDLIGFGMKVSANLSKVASVKTLRGLSSWKAVNPATKKMVYRGLLGATLFISLHQRTIPNLDKIAAGMGRLLTNIISGGATFIGSAMASATKALLDELLNPSYPPALRKAIVLFITWGTAIMGLLFIFSHFRSKRNKYSIA